MSESTKHRLKVFLCHAKADKQKVRELYRYLHRRRVEPWFDEVDLMGGQDWQVEIPKALATSDAVIICLTKNAVDKEGYIQKEIKFALDKALEMPEGKIFLIPVRFEECDVPFSLSRFQWVDLFREEGYARMMRALKFRASQLERATVQVPKPNESKPDLSSTPDQEHSLDKLKSPINQSFVQETKLQSFQKQTAREEAEHDIAERVELEKAEQEESISVNQEFREQTQPKESPHAIPLEKVEQDRKENERVVQSGMGEESPHNVPEQKNIVLKFNWRRLGGIAGGLIGIGLFVWIGSRLMNLPVGTPEPTRTFQPTRTFTYQPSPTNTPSSTDTPISPTPTLGIGLTSVSNTDGATLVYVPEGKFLMGSNYEPPPESAPTYYDFRPQYQVTLNAFWIDQTEVTNKQYAMCVSARDCVLPLSLKSPKRSSYYGDSQYEDYPVIYIDWFMAKAYCEWAGRRLPTEAEWEKAARGTDGRIYPWGNEAPDTLPNVLLLNYNDYWIDTSVVRQYPAGKSPYGAYDMAGNVWEWTSSLYMPYPYDATDGREDLSAKRERVLRGGSWYFDKNSSISIFRWGVAPADFLVRSDVRSWAIPSFSSGRNMPYGAGTLGFRCAMSATP